MFFVCRSVGNFKADESDGRRTCVRVVVDGVGSNGNTVNCYTDNQFDCGENYVNDDTDNATEKTIFLTNGIVRCVVIIFNEKFLK